MTLYGADSAVVAADLAAARFADGDLAGYAIWLRIGSAIMDFARPGPDATDCVN